MLTLIFLFFPTVLDEATSALTSKQEEELYQILITQGTTLVSVGHRERLKKFHDSLLTLKGNGLWSLDTIWDCCEVKRTSAFSSKISLSIHSALKVQYSDRTSRAIGLTYCFNISETVALDFKVKKYGFISWGLGQSLCKQTITYYTKGKKHLPMKVTSFGGINVSINNQQQ